MSARQRFVVGSRLLLACVCFVGIGGALWSRIESYRHVTEDVAYACLDITGAKCEPPFHIKTAPNRVPALSFFIMGGAAGIVGAVLITSHPRLVKSHEQPTST